MESDGDWMERVTGRVPNAMHRPIAGLGVGAESGFHGPEMDRLKRERWPQRRDGGGRLRGMGQRNNNKVEGTIRWSC